MKYQPPSLEVVEAFDREEAFYAPLIPWLTIAACILVTIGTTLVPK